MEKGFSLDEAQKVAAQGSNFLVGDDWEQSVRDASPEIKSVIERHKDAVIPSATVFLESDKKSREIVVNLLRIKSVVMMIIEGPSSKKYQDTAISNEELTMLHLTRKDAESTASVFGGSEGKWMDDPMRIRIENILGRFGVEFPEGPDPVRFGKMVAEFYRAIRKEKGAR